MNIQRWLARREPKWQRLGKLLSKLDKKGFKSFPSSEIREIASLYRSVSADLARAKTHQLGKTVINDLQQLTLRSYSHIYQGSRRQEWSAIAKFYRWRFPQVVQQTWIYIAIATAICGVSALMAWWYGWQDPTFLALVIPADLIHSVRDDHELWMGSILGVEPLASSNIMTNNLSVAFKAVAGGITGGIFTIYILFFNGILLGAIGALVGQYQLGYPFWAFVLPHGSLELPAIFLAGAAGLLIARALLFPGQYRRSEALKYYGKQAAELMFGVVPMLVIAGIIEGFFSPNPIFPDASKYIVGGLIFTSFLLYCSRSTEDQKANLF